MWIYKPLNIIALIGESTPTDSLHLSKIILKTSNSIRNGKHNDITLYNK